MRLDDSGQRRSEHLTGAVDRAISASDRLAELRADTDT
jgi:hypothetical protein